MDHIFCPFEIKLNQQEEGTISGNGSTFGNVDTYGDTVAKGAYKKTIADAQNGNGPWPAMLLQHGRSNQTPIGIWTHLEENLDSPRRK